MVYLSDHSGSVITRNDSIRVIIRSIRLVARNPEFEARLSEAMETGERHRSSGGYSVPVTHAHSTRSTHRSGTNQIK